MSLKTEIKKEREDFLVKISYILHPTFKVTEVVMEYWTLFTSNFEIQYSLFLTIEAVI